MNATEVPLRAVLAGLAPALLFAALAAPPAVDT